MMLLFSTPTPISLSLFLHLSHLVLSLAYTLNGTTPPVPAVIVFGDSIVDTGNNNFLKTLIKSNFPPYGINFPGHQPTGRFSDGRIASDFIVSKLGLKEFLPPYVGMKLGPQDLLTGVTFASGGAGYDPLTAKIVSVISMSDQLELFKDYKEKVREIAGEERAARIVRESLYVVCAGSDDVANTYSSTPFRKEKYDIPSYADLLLRSASSFLEDLIHLGAQKIGIVGIPPIGCVPSQRTLAGGIFKNCATDENQIAKIFNSELPKELQRLTTKHQGTTLVYIDIFTILFDIIEHPYNYGFEVSRKGCCGTGNLEVSVLCNSLTSVVCLEVSKHVFWDSYHPTERAYDILLDWVFEKYISFLI